MAKNKIIKMIQVLRDSKPKARKNYKCDACRFIFDHGYSRDIIQDLTFSEKRSIVRARKNNWQIQKGEVYLYQFNKMDGDAYTFRAIPDINDICQKYDLYPDDF